MIELLCTDYNKKATSIHYNLNSAVLVAIWAYVRYSRRYSSVDSNRSSMLSFGVLPRRRCFSAQPFRKISTILLNVDRFTPVILRNFVFEYSAIFSYFMSLFYHDSLFSQEVYQISSIFRYCNSGCPGLQQEFPGQSSPNLCVKCIR